MRVIAGALGGRRLTAPRGQATRPTSDRVREALFSTLGDLTGAAVLDLYAGTGALGIEALSRGAARAVFVESARPALAALRQNLTTLDLLGVARVMALPVGRALTEITRAGPFDLILVDPPYAEAADALVIVGRLAGAAAPSARVVLEHASREAPPTVEQLHVVSTRAYGDTALSFYEVASAR